MTDQIRFKDKQGRLRYIADSKGTIKQVNKDGSLKNIEPAKNPKQKDTKK